MDHAKVVGAGTDVGKQFAYWMAALAMLMEFPRRLEQVSGGGKLHTRLRARVGLAVIAIQQRLGIKRVDVRRATLHEQKDDPLGPRREMRRLRSERILLRPFARFREQRGERQGAKADRGAGEQLATGES
jgi:hypothetical protein